MEGGDGGGTGRDRWEGDVRVHFFKFIFISLIGVSFIREVGV